MLCVSIADEGRAAIHNALGTVPQSLLECTVHPITLTTTAVPLGVMSPSMLGLELLRSMLAVREVILLETHLGPVQSLDGEGHEFGLRHSRAPGEMLAETATKDNSAETVLQSFMVVGDDESLADVSTDDGVGIVDAALVGRIVESEGRRGAVDDILFDDTLVAGGRGRVAEEVATSRDHILFDYPGGVRHGHQARNGETFKTCEGVITGRTVMIHVA